MGFQNNFTQLVSDRNQNVSKVVDENGEPLVVYHATAEDFTEFDASRRGELTAARSTADSAHGSVGLLEIRLADVMAFLLSEHHGGEPFRDIRIGRLAAQLAF